MDDVFDATLKRIEAIVKSGLDADGTMRILELLQAPPISQDILRRAKIYSEALPKAQECPFTEEQRFLHFLWDAFDKLPLSLITPFSIPFRRHLAHRLFKKCGKALIVEENVRFNFGQFLEVGSNVFFNRNVFLDSKGGIFIGEAVALAEDVRVFTHSHCEACHMERTYAPVHIGDYAKVYSGATIMPGVTIGEQAIVASGAIITKDVPANMVAAGIPAKVIRERKTQGKHREELDHIWLY